MLKEKCLKVLVSYWTRDFLAKDVMTLYQVRRFPQCLLKEKRPKLLISYWIRDPNGRRGNDVTRMLSPHWTRIHGPNCHCSTVYSERSIVTSHFPKNYFNVCLTTTIKSIDYILYKSSLFSELNISE